MKIHPCWFVTLTFVSSALSQELPSSATRPFEIPQSLGVLIDEADRDGVFWIRTDTYKARLEGSTVTFFPWFSNAAEHTPFRLSLANTEAGQFKRSGEAFRVQHSPELSERWEARSDGMEQIFVLSSPPSTADFELRISVETRLQYIGHNGGLVFEAPGLGQLSYQDGVVFDAAGKRAPLFPAFENDTIVLRVPASFLEAASYPVTIDPLLSVLTLANASSRSRFHPDVVREAQSRNDFVIVYEEQFNASDNDILGLL